MKILISAEPQGFGIASVARTIASFLKGHHVNYIANDLAYIYFKKEGGQIFHHNNYRNIRAFRNLLRQHDIFLSVNESKLAIIAKKLGFKVIYFDLLFWLWQDKINDDILDAASDFYKKPISHLSRIFSSHSNKKYDLKFIENRAFFAITAGLISDATCLQDFPPLTGTKKKLLNRRKNINYIHPILRKNSTCKRNKSKKEILISLGGVPSQNNYAQVFAKTFSMLKRQTSFKLASSDLHKHCDFQYKLYKQKDLHDAILNANVVLTPPGFTTMCEIFNLKKPVIYLPPKNAGVHKMSRVFSDFGLDEFSIRWEDIYPQLAKYKDSWDVMRIVERNMLRDKELPSLLNEKILAHVDYLSRVPNARKKLVKKQSQFLRWLINQNGHFEELFKQIIKSSKM